MVKVSYRNGVDNGWTAGTLAYKNFGTRQAGWGSRARDGRQVLNLSTWQIEVSCRSGAVHPDSGDEPLGVVSMRSEVIDSFGSGDCSGERIGTSVQREAMTQCWWEIGW